MEQANNSLANQFRFYVEGLEVMAENKTYDRIDSLAGEYHRMRQECSERTISRTDGMPNDKE